MNKKDKTTLKQDKNPHPEMQYLNLLERIIKEGEERKDRTQTGTLSIFGSYLSFNLQDEFPLLTTKKIHFKSVVYELLWFLRGDTNIQFLKQNACNIWNEWADEKDEIGPLYGYQWRKWDGENGKHYDQITSCSRFFKKRSLQS